MMICLFPMVVAVGEPKFTRTSKLWCNYQTTKGVQKNLTLSSIIQNIVASNRDSWYSRLKGLQPAFSSKNMKRMNDVSSKRLMNGLTLIEKGAAFGDVCE